MDEDKELSAIALGLASNCVDEQLVHHPELINMRETLLRSKTKQLESEMVDENKNLYNELKIASDLIKEHFKTLPREEFDDLMKTLTTEKGENDPNKTLQENMKLSKEMMQVIYSFALSLQKKDLHQDAAAVFKFLIILNPLISDFWSALGLSQLCLDSTREALKSFQNSILNDPKNPKGYYLTAYTLHLLKDDSAINQIEEALKLKDSPSFLEWEPTLKEIQEMLKKEKEAL